MPRYSNTTAPPTAHGSFIRDKNAFAISCPRHFTRYHYRAVQHTPSIASTRHMPSRVISYYSASMSSKTRHVPTSIFLTKLHMQNKYIGD
jgi:hypothetical protein